MNPDPQTGRKSPLKNPLVYSSLLILVVVFYIGYILLNRRESLRQFEKREADKQAEKRREDDRQAIEQLGGSQLSIRSLYVTPSTVAPGETAQLCYDVDNAKTVTLDPPVAEVWPSHSRCVDLKTRKPTTYTLTIADSAGKTLSQSVELKVR